MSSTLRLANALDSLDRDELQILLTHRPVRKVAQDALELAEMLLQSASIECAVTRLDSAKLIALVRLRDGGQVDACDAHVLLGLGLIGREADKLVSLPEVDSVLARLFRQRKLNENELVAAFDRVSQALSECAAAADKAKKAEASNQHWYAPALTLTQHTAAILRWMTATPGKVGRRGDIAASTIKALEASLAIERDATSRDLELLRNGSLVASTEVQTLRVTETGQDWLNLSHEERWVSLAKLLIAATPPHFMEFIKRFSGRFELALDHTQDFFPLLDADDVGRLDDLAVDYARYGLTVSGVLTDAAWMLLTDDDAAAAELAEANFPEPVSGVYVQPDLSIVVPGPLPASDETVLWSVAQVEQFGLAATLRVSDSSLKQALENGFEAEEIRGELERLSLTGIPQPLNYLLTSLGETRSLLTVKPYEGAGARTVVSSPSVTLLKQLEVDRRLAHLRLTAATGESTELFSQLSPDHVLSALRDARYQAQSLSSEQLIEANTAAFEPSPVQKRRSLEEETAALTAENVVESGESDDLPRLLELAIREHTRVHITAEAAGRTYEFNLLPLALAGGRLRASDPVAQVERTLPLSSIVAIKPAD